MSIDHNCQIHCTIVQKSKPHFSPLLQHTGGCWGPIPFNHPGLHWDSKPWKPQEYISLEFSALVILTCIPTSLELKFACVHWSAWYFLWYLVSVPVPRIETSFVWKDASITSLPSYTKHASFMAGIKIINWALWSFTYIPGISTRIKKGNAKTQHPRAPSHLPMTWPLNKYDLSSQQRQHMHQVLSKHTQLFDKFGKLFWSKIENVPRNIQGHQRTSKDMNKGHCNNICKAKSTWQT